MHEVYEKIWNIALKINEKAKLPKKTIFLILNTFIWCFAGCVIYLLFSMLSIVEFSYINMFVTLGYFGVILGYFGAVLYILRNTEPDEII